MDLKLVNRDYTYIISTTYLSSSSQINRQKNMIQMPGSLWEEVYSNYCVGLVELLD